MTFPCEAILFASKDVLGNLPQGEFAHFPCGGGGLSFKRSLVRHIPSTAGTFRGIAAIVPQYRAIWGHY